MAKGTVAERIAESTWNRLRASQDLDVRLGEETLTDLLVLDFLVSKPSNIKFFQTTKPDEAVQGTDLEIRVRRGDNAIDRYAVQAKRLSVAGRYDSLKHRSGQTQQWQIDVLERYAEEQKAIPLYLLFNHVADGDLNDDYWHCCQQTIDKRQFGCTLVPSWRIREAISTYGCRTFVYIHSDRAALPWRCAFACPNSQTMWGRIREKAEESHRELISGNHGTTRRYEGVDFSSGVGRWSSDLWERRTSSLSAEETMRSYGASSSQSDALDISRPMFLPRWIMLVNSDDS